MSNITQYRLDQAHLGHPGVVREFLHGLLQRLNVGDKTLDFTLRLKTGDFKVAIPRIEWGIPDFKNMRGINDEALRSVLATVLEAAYDSQLRLVVTPEALHHTARAGLAEQLEQFLKNIKPGTHRSILVEVVSQEETLYFYCFIIQGSTLPAFSELRALNIDGTAYQHFVAKALDAAHDLLLGEPA